ncbi:CDP-alcohol phosphatidyltransferase family protein [Sinosporangium album]|nr:CDP-alcohol phosphatidyltransferase family protein [Sinosporangium album]
MRTFSLEDIHAARKRRDSWWTVFAVDPLACRLALIVANRTEITPNGLTVFSLLLGMGSAASLALGHLWAGALLFYLSFMVDCMDGKIARLKGTGTPFGLWLDYVGDRIRVVFCAAGLAYGQYAVTGDILYIVVGAGIAVLDLFRYVNAPQMKRVRDTVKRHRRALYPPRPREEMDALPSATEAPAVPVAAAAAGTAGTAGTAAAVHALPAHGGPAPAGSTAHAGATGKNAETGVTTEAGALGTAAEQGGGPFRRFDRFLARHRVRSHLISGIEFHAAVFVVAPLLGAGALVPISVGAGALLLANEIFLVYRMWLYTRGAARPADKSHEHALA